jgi:hypothetical protein
MPHHTSAPREPQQFAEFCAQMIARYAPASSSQASFGTTVERVA